MPDFGAPVAQDVNVNPAQGLQTLSTLYGIQQQQQNIAYTRAEAQQAQQKNAELQALSRYTRQAMTDPSMRNSDGSLNVQKFQNGAQAVAPTYGQAYIGQATTNANEAIKSRKALLSLSNEQRQTAGNYFGAYATTQHGDPRGAFLDTGEQALSVSDDPAYRRSVLGFVMHAPDVSKLPTAQADQVLRQYARQAAVATQAPNAPLSAPAVSTVQGKAGLVPININPMAPGGTGAVGAPIPNVAPPAIVTPPGGIPTVTGPGGSSPRQVPGTGPGPTPTSQDWEAFGAYNANLNARVAIASDSIPRIQEAEQALDAIRGGAGAEVRAGLARKLQAIGAPKAFVDAVAGGNLAAAQEAEKYLFQTTFSGLKQSMQGDPSRVAEFTAAEKIFPQIGTDPRASKAILQFMKDQGQRDYAEQQALRSARTQGNFNPVTWQAQYQAALRAGKVPGVPSSQVPGSATQEGATGKSKSGRAMVYHNGQWEYR